MIHFTCSYIQNEDKNEALKWALGYSSLNLSILLCIIMFGLMHYSTCYIGTLRTLQMCMLMHENFVLLFRINKLSDNFFFTLIDKEELFPYGGMHLIFDLVMLNYMVIIFCIRWLDQIINIDSVVIVKVNVLKVIFQLQ